MRERELNLRTPLILKPHTQKVASRSKSVHFTSNLILNVMFSLYKHISYANITGEQLLLTKTGLIIS